MTMEERWLGLLILVGLLWLAGRLWVRVLGRREKAPGSGGTANLERC